MMKTIRKSAHPSLKTSRPALALATIAIVLQACGGGGGGGGGGGSSTADIAGVWDVVDDSALGFDVVEIHENGNVTTYFEDTFDNCYTLGGGSLTNEGGDVYGYIPTGYDTAIISYTFVNEGNSLRYTSSFLDIDEVWPALAISVDDFNICS